MKCQYCGTNEAEQSFIFNYMGEEHKVHLCGECRDKLYHHYAAMQRAAANGQAPFGALPGFPLPNRGVGEAPFPTDAGHGVQRRRHMNSLKARLDEAVAKERYEDAARLRDEILSIEKEVHTYEQ